MRPRVPCRGWPFAAAPRLLLCALVALAAATACRRKAAPVFPGAPIVLISIDTLRADHLPTYGYAGVETPALKALEADSIVFENALAQVPLTLPSHVCLFTGLLPFQNGVRDNQGYHLDKTHRTLASFLSARGYATGAAVSAFALSHFTGISEGFDFYEDGIESRRAGQALGQLQRSGWQSEKLLEDWIEKQPSGKPLFAFLHLYEPHSPYDPPEPFRSRYAARPYDGEIAAADAIVGKFLEFLKGRGLYDRSVIVFLSDHGEGLGDHGEDEHGIFVYRESIRVPLFVKLPGRASPPQRVRGAVGLVDVFPTVVSLLGEEPSRDLPGASLLALAREPRTERRVYSETLYPRFHLGWSDLASLSDDRFQYIDSPRPELYDWRADPGERTDLASQLPPAFRSMRVELQAMSRPLQDPGAADPETLRKLAALGYISATSPRRDAKDLPSPRDRIRILDRLKTGSRLATENREDESIAVLRQLANENPEMLEVWETLAMVLRRAGRQKEAIEALQHADRLVPGTPQILLGLAELYVETRDFEKARSLVEAAALAGQRDVHEELAVISLEQGDLAAARSQIQQALRSGDGTLRRPWLILARIEQRGGNLAAALEDVERALEIERKWNEPPMVDLQATRADILARMGREQEAEQAFRSEIRSFPENLNAWSRLALLYASQGRVKEFRDLLSEMVRETPSARTLDTAVKLSETVGDRQGATEWERRKRERLAKAS
ncbi:MAG TPA: sulfatase-like hydrolase/transferase [Thermoanaerobaculia bacterium]|nr:sulfatase-like hydrolase/transferase [Thermoanaerobaculia bacterium]